MQICVAVIFCKLSQYVFTLYSGAHPVHRRFVFSADMLSSMMAILPPEKFRPHLAAVERTLLWAETHEKTDVVQQSAASRGHLWRSR